MHLTSPMPIRFGYKMRLECGHGYKPHDFTTKEIVDSLRGQGITDILVLSNQAQELNRLNIKAPVWAKTGFHSTDMPDPKKNADVILTEEDARSTQRHLKALNGMSPMLARQFSDAVGNGPDAIRLVENTFLNESLDPSYDRFDRSM